MKESFITRFAIDLACNQVHNYVHKLRFDRDERKSNVHVL